MISRTTIRGSARMDFLPKHFGQRGMLRGESAIYQQMRFLCSEYDSGFWEFFELDNGGFYMVPQGLEHYRLSCPGNGFEGVLSADATGIVVTLMALCGLAVGDQTDRSADSFYKLRDYALEHHEAGQILAAID